MEELATIFNNAGILVAALAGGLSLVMFGFAGIQYMTAQGDPQGMSRAKMSVIGAVVGLAIAGLAFVMPAIVSRIIIEPAGGQRVDITPGQNCDRLLKNQFVFQRGASTAARMNEVIRQVQARYDSCEPEVWNPRVDVLAYFPKSCWGPGGLGELIPVGPFIGGMIVPRGLRIYDGSVRRYSGRDNENNVLVYWDLKGTLTDTSDDLVPSDGSHCWLYVKRLNQWGMNQ